MDTLKSKKISLCLGGGGARGFIHIGVLRYLEEQGYEIEEISGNSMGAVIAGAHALGLTSSEIHDFVKEEFSVFKMIDFTLGAGLISGNKIFECFKRLYGHSKIESTSIPLSIIATRLDDSKKVVFTDGKILDAVRASMSVPSIFTPHKIDGKSYVDGMLCSNLPVECLNGDNILAVSTSLSAEFPFSTAKQRITKSINIGLTQAEDVAVCNSDKNITLMRPVYDEIDFIDFHKYDKIIEIGYIAAKKQLG
ncbi:patatin-like phospholipase family protein [Candidatus Gracilibacteria bacterium]|nr:patatin-like phospholipase family protein [Candidatus Gracilibacteria bacterium]